MEEFRFPWSQVLRHVIEPKIYMLRSVQTCFTFSTLAVYVLRGPSDPNPFH